MLREKQNEILSVLYDVCLAYEKAIEQDANQFKRYQKALHSVKLDLMQKGFDDFNDDAFNRIKSLKKEFSEKERSKRENLAQLNEVIYLFKESIDKVFDRVSAFTWEKYKIQNTKKKTTMKKTTGSLNRSKRWCCILGTVLCVAWIAMI